MCRLLYLNNLLREGVWSCQSGPVNSILALSNIRLRDTSKRDLMPYVSSRYFQERNDSNRRCNFSFAADCWLHVTAAGACRGSLGSDAIQISKGCSANRAGLLHRQARRHLVSN